MKKTKLMILGIIIIVVAVLAGFAVINYLGPVINDNYAQKQMSEFRSVLSPYDSKIKVIEESKYVGENSATKRFVIISAVVVKSNVSNEKTEEYIKSVSELEEAIVVPYSNEYANELEFMGIQKDVYNMTLEEISREGYYIIILEKNAKIILDKRHPLLKNR